MTEHKVNPRRSANNGMKRPEVAKRAAATRAEIWALGRAAKASGFKLNADKQLVMAVARNDPP